MNYTENYHLPQWVKSDRVLMEDFNRMCADIEAGLSQTRADIDAGLSSVRDAAAQNKNALSQQIGTVQRNAASDLQKGLFRLTYNHCAHLLERDTVPALDGAFAQLMNGDGVPENCQGFWVHQDGIWCASSGPDLTHESLQATLEEGSPLKMVKDNLSACEKGVYRFKPTGAACITELRLTGNYLDHDKQTPVRFRVVLTDMTRGVTEYDREMEADTTRGHDIFLYFPTEAFLHGGDTYQFEFIPLNAPLTGTLRHKAGDALGLLTYSRSASGCSGVVSHTFGQTETGQGGLILARYSAWDKGGTLTASWGGRTQQPSRVRTFTDSKGREIEEAEFRFLNPIAGGSTVTLNASVPVRGDILVYNWCAALV